MILVFIDVSDYCDVLLDVVETCRAQVQASLVFLVHANESRTLLAINDMTFDETLVRDVIVVLKDVAFVNLASVLVLLTDVLTDCSDVHLNERWCVT